jgi:DNA-3-methyladenine glycosylase II
VTVLRQTYLKARRHLSRRDPILKDVIRPIGICTLNPDPDRFGILARSIISQQISGKAAAAIGNRLVEALGRKGLTPRGIILTPDRTLRSAGLSENKLRSLRDLAEKVESALVPLAVLHEMDDEEVIDRLIQVRGIGRWTAQMFLIFSLGRLDVLPVDDFGLRMAVQRHYLLDELPRRSVVAELGQPWQPYRSIATWYFWRSLGPVPRSDEPDAPPSGSQRR